jgi:cell division septation protein DedD
VASSGSMSTGMFVLAAVAAVAVSAVGGYFLAGIQQPKQTDTTQAVQASQPQASPVATDSDKAVAPPPTQSPDYTAQDAPDISIREERAPIAPPTPKTDDTAQTSQSVDNSAGTNDSEASQEASPASPTDAPDANTTVGTAPAPGNAPALSASTPDQGGPTTLAAPTQTSDQDTGQSNSATAPAPTLDTTQAPVASRIVRYRVEVGSFTQAMSARSLADVLRTRGYSTDTVTEHNGDRSVYHVQAGAFRSRSDAESATVELQQQGFPAFVSVIPQ